ncbi:MAG TPA: rhomboid family intramembrane serine protease [Gemmataceae bacterium]|nr:rhomboid family intramembrane serine protease [Gemmataceae bacterium]
MVLPLADDNSDRRFPPLVNYGLIAVNVFVFVVLQGLGTNDDFTYAFSTVPEEIITGKDLVTEDRDFRDPETGRDETIPGLRATPITVYITLLTSMFMHGGIAHILGNMLFLWIFGDNIENVLGHGRYLAFYLVCGILSSLAHVFATVAISGAGSPEAQIPSLGASGAISGVLGAYMLLFPTRRVLVLLFRVLTWVPAYVAVGIWFAFQLISGLGMLGGKSDGVAYAAHIGGFVVGLALIKVFMIGLPNDPGDLPPRGVPWRQ